MFHYLSNNIFNLPIKLSFDFNIKCRFAKYNRFIRTTKCIHMSELLIHMDW